MKSRRVSDAIWLEAHDLYREDVEDGVLWKQPEDIQLKYMARALQAIKNDLERR
jgi:hypothetical protein